jgi:hypothetical protein
MAGGRHEQIHERAEAQTKQIIGQMLGDELLVQEGKKQQEEATEPGSSDGGHDQGIVRDERGQEQPRDKERAQRVSRVDRGGDPPGKKEGLTRLIGILRPHAAEAWRST